MFSPFRVVLGASLVVAMSCAQETQVPSGPDHPADPTAAPAPEPHAARLPAAEPHAPAEDHHAGHGHAQHRPAKPEHAEPESGASSDLDALMAAEMAAYQAAKPVFEAACASCHTSGKRKNRGALKHFGMDGYPFTGHHADELGATIRKVLGVDGGKITMPKDDPGSVTGADLDLIVAWSRAYDRAQRAGAGYHGQAERHDHGGKSGKSYKKHGHDKGKQHDH